MPISRLNRGQGKPWPSIPRIDWSHPLAKGLQFYCLFGATGPGFELDLVSGLHAKFTANDLVTTSQNGLVHTNNYATVASSKTALVWPVGTGTKTSDGAGGGDYTIAAGHLPKTVPIIVTAPDTIGMSNSGQTIFSGIDWSIPNTGGATANFAGFGANGTDLITATNCFNLYTTGAHSRSGSNTRASVACNRSFATATATDSGAVWASSTGVYVNVFADPSSPTTTESTCVTQLSWAGMWARALTQAEIVLLHQDPYCFLIYPEDEYFARRVRGVIADAASSVFAPQSFFEVAKLKQPTEFAQGPFKGTSPALATTFATSAFFDPVKLKQPTVDKPAVTFQPATTVVNIVEQPFFEPVKLKRPTVDNSVVPVNPAKTPTVEQAFFDQIKLKRPTEFSPGPNAGTSPALTQPYVTSAFFDVVRLKQPIVDRPSDVPPLVVVVNLSATNWFDAVKLLKIPERFGELYPQQYWTPQAYTPWFEQLKLLKIPERLQEAFGVPFPPVAAQTSQSLTGWFDAVQKLKVPGDMPFTATGAVQVNTVKYAITDWFERTKLKQPIVETPLVVYFPAQQIVVASELHDVQFIANVGRLMGH